MIRVVLPTHLRTLAGTGREVSLEMRGAVHIASVLDAIEAKYPMLCGTMRDHVTLQRRPLVRFFVCEEDWSHESMNRALPEQIVSGAEPLYIIGAIAGG